MFRPDQNCIIHSSNGKTSVFGVPTKGRKSTERCVVVTINIMSEKSAVRADTSASRGNARELVSDIDVLLSPKTVARIDDIIEVAGFKFRISRVCMRHNLQGRLDHFQIGGTFWSAE